MTSVAPAGFSPRRGAAARAVSSPWTQIVRGDSEGLLTSPSAATVASSVIEQLVVSGSAAAPAVEDSAGESSDNGNAGADKRLAWNKPSNGAAVAAAEVEPVMGADSWPPLSESTKAPAKSSTESLKLIDGAPVPVPATQGTTSSSLSSPKQANPPNMVPARQRSMKRNGSGNTSANSGLSQLPASQAPSVDMPPANHSPRVAAQRSGVASHPHNGNNNSQRNTYRNRNGGPQPRADGSHHYNHGGRRDQDRGNQDWNAHRHFSGRNAHINQHRVVPRFAAPLQHPSSAAFMPPSSVRHFGSPIGFPELSPVYFVATPPPESLRSGVPFVAPIPPHAVFLHPPDHQLHGKIVNQIHYYFSNENLIKDTYLRQNMDEQGWVPIKLLAGFKQVKLLTENIQLIADAVRASTVVEVQGDKVRRRNDWMRWIMPPAYQFSSNANPPQPAGTSNHDTVANSFQGLNIEEKATNKSRARGQADLNEEPLLGVSKSGEIDNSEGTSEGNVPSRN